MTGSLMFRGLSDCGQRFVIQSVSTVKDFAETSWDGMIFYWGVQL